jgi:hypothetical protein
MYFHMLLCTPLHLQEMSYSCVALGIYSFYGLTRDVHAIQILFYGGSQCETPGIMFFLKIFLLPSKLPFYPLVA